MQRIVKGNIRIVHYKEKTIHKQVMIKYIQRFLIENNPSKIIKDYLPLVSSTSSFSTYLFNKIRFHYRWFFFHTKSEYLYCKRWVDKMTYQLGTLSVLWPVNWEQGTDSPTFSAFGKLLYLRNNALMNKFFGNIFLWCVDQWKFIKFFCHFIKHFQIIEREVPLIKNVCNVTEAACMNTKHNKNILNGWDYS